MIVHKRLLACAVCLVWAGGCASGGNYDFWHPGNMQTQRIRAVVHDPYPDQDLAPPVVGGRPREFSEPLPEAVKNRIYTDSFWGR
jgi:hypothetical protein